MKKNGKILAAGLIKKYFPSPLASPEPFECLRTGVGREDLLKKFPLRKLFSTAPPSPFCCHISPPAIF